MTIVLDTNVISEVMRPIPEPKVMNWLRSQPVDKLAITAVTIAEISYGILRLREGRRRQELETNFCTFVTRGFSRSRIWSFNRKAAEIYAELVVTRQQQGRPIEAFDAMIAAIAKSRGADIATRNVTDFENCGVSIINPWQISLCVREARSR